MLLFHPISKSSRHHIMYVGQRINKYGFHFVVPYVSSNTSSSIWQHHRFKCGTHQQKIQQSDLGKGWNKT